MIGPTDETIYDSYVDEVTGIWFFDVPVAGATEEAVEAKILAGLPIVGAADFELRRITNSAWEVDFFPKVRKTALDEPRTITVPPEVDWERMSVAAFYDECGKAQFLSLSGTSGTLVGGLPGGGKTAFITEFLAPLLVDNRVRVTVADGKAGADFDSVRDYLDCYWADDEDFDGMISLLESKQAVMRERIKTNKALTGESNFWNSPITPQRPVELIVIDEVQTWTEKTGRPKAEKEKMERIEALIRDLVKRGRSAGMHVMLSTQKPDASTINTGIRDLCGRRVCFRVTTPEMQTMILGAVPEDAASPTMIPADRIGGCVIGSDSGQLVQARTLYFPERSLEAYLAAHGTRKQSLPEVGADEDVPGEFEGGPGL
ncbi:FtsK/SpoIIIE domain-containing protein [Corynebacterium sp.]|uniref:FtsK/SpoIIIE domain-containing protein n=1 Tax=Corynebacterium sp. TaxID=1720 RepID=UPI0025B93C2A|nr:FtsK/SpoIIIE domain-containing protein [Corynebacterium sp.]